MNTETERIAAVSRREISDATHGSASEDLAELLTLAEQTSQVGTWVLDVATNRLTWSDQTFRIFGFDPTQPPPDRDVLLGAYDGDDAERLVSRIDQAIRLVEGYEHQAQVTRLDGAVRRVTSRGFPRCDEHGDVVAVYGTVQDVTDLKLGEHARREIEEELRHQRLETRAASEALVLSEARYRMLAERIADIIARLDSNGVIEYVSPSIRQLGYEPEEVVGRNVSDFIDPETPNAHVLGALERGEPLPTGRSNELRLRRADGAYVWVQGNPAPVFDDEGNPIGLVTVVRDITERRSIEDELRRKTADAEASAVAKAQFLANMSHEIRTPLTGVIGFAGLLERLNGLPDRARTYIERITAGGQALLSIVNDVLDFSRLEAGTIDLDVRPTDLEALLNESIGLVTADAHRKGLDLRLERRGDLPVTVLADGDHVRQVLLNLLSNAIKFTSTGSVALAVSYSAERDGILRFEVTDTGVGISAEHLDRLFQRFSQVDGSNTREFGGAGLGLAISQGLTEMMGGQIGVASTRDRGSTFWFTIKAPLTIQRPDVGVKAGQDLGLRPLKVLAVDDMTANREIVAALLAPFDIQLTEATSGAEAVEASLSIAFDLILMDIQMPGMDGMAATQAIRANSDLNRSTPVLAVSANVMPSQVDACRRAGMNDHIGKPINPSELLGKIALWTEPQDIPETAQS